MEKVLSRVVYDDLVKEKVTEDAELQAYLSGATAYRKTVKTGLDMVQLNKSKNGLIPKDIVHGLRAKVQHIMSDHDANLQGTLNMNNGTMDLVKIPMSYKESCILKALALEQISHCEEYALVMSCVFMNIATSILDRSHVIKWEIFRTANDTHQVIYDAVKEYVCDYLKEE